MNILIVGANGSMGQRYQAILNQLKYSYTCCDIDTQNAKELADKATAFIIATPTNTHLTFIKHLSRYGKPILCEKPLSTDMGEVSEIIDLIKTRGINLCMMAQYDLLIEAGHQGKTLFDYFRHGNDGLVWDCIQIVGNANGETELFERSPIWRCQINGQELDIKEMDKAYVDFVERWLGGYKQDANELFNRHLKTHQYYKDFSNAKRH